ncbi:P-loop containing nucleoside triphosphate hydrolase protein [Rhypophila decipiens]
MVRPHRGSARGLRAQREDVMAIPTPDRTDIGSDVMTEGRAARSGAPSVDTRAAVPATISEEVEHVEDNDRHSDIQVLPTRSVEIKQLDEDEPDVMLMQCIKREPENDASTLASIQGSFIGPNLALKEFGQELKEGIDALAEIQSRGISHVANLPELVLVGDQSSGKSSLMSAIAGLSLPRSSGTCTRCPLHIRISRSPEWSCRVFLKEDYEFRPPTPGHPITIDDVTSSNKFPPWRPLPASRQARHEFKTVRDRFDAEVLETILKCAQVAILNPSTATEWFVPKLEGEAPRSTRQQHLERVMEKAESSEAQFSPNTIDLEVKGPDLADLSFYDLPGVFITARRPEDRFLERVVKNLTCDYISRPNAIILWAVPMNQDAENSFAFKIIRDLKAVDRCVGVMTKADLLSQDPAANRNWIAMLEERAHRTGLGYFVTSRQEGELEDQNKREEAFFNRTPGFDANATWPIAFDKFKERCGVEKLKAFLSLKLYEEFCKVIPEVKLKVNNRLHELVQQLEKYPAAPANAEMEIMRSLSQFSTRVKARFQDQQFMSLWDLEAAENFKKGILGLKPRFNVIEPGPSKRVVIDLVDSPPPASRKRPGQASNPVTPSKRPRGEPVSAAVKAEELTPGTGTPYSFPRSGSAIPFPLTPMISAPPRSKDLKAVRSLIRRHAVPGRPHLVSNSVYEPLFTESARLWMYHLDVYIGKTFNLLEVEIMRILEASFPTLKSRAVYKESVERMKEFITSHRDDLRTQLFMLYNLESKVLFTKDEDTLQRNMASERKILERHRYHCRMAARNGVELGPIPKLEEMSDEDIAKEAAKMAKDSAMLGPDPYDQEVAVAAYVRGYYLTAANRFIDLVCIHFMSGLLPEMATMIEHHLDEKLDLGPRGATPDVLERLVSEGDDIARKRRDLRAEKERLDQALEIITDLQEHRRGTPRVMNGQSEVPNGNGLTHLVSGANPDAPPRMDVRSPSHRSMAGSVTQYGDL